MQVNRDNFPAIFPKFVQLLQTCDFFSFDEEMTGINTPDLPECITDTPEESYRAKSTVASRYNIIQVGICLFHKEKDATKSAPAQYIARPFNFLLFPNHADDFTAAERSRDVVLSPSSLSFLRRHDMNFQYWVYNGMAYCDGVQEEALRKKHQEKYQKEVFDTKTDAKRKDTQGIDLMTEDEKKWFDNAVATAQAFSDRIQAALERAANEKHSDVVFPSQSMVEVAASMDLLQSGGREVFLPPQRSKNVREKFERYLEQNIPNISLTFRRQGVMQSGTLHAIFPEERSRMLIKEQTHRERELMDMLGFRLVFKALAESNKPCVGHNCFADILFLFASLEGPLPGTLLEFKERMRQVFPIVFDTRYIASRQDYFPVGRFGSRYLSGYFGEYGFHSANVHVTLPLGFESYDPLTVERSSFGSKGGGGGPTHEAGYDALLTGTLLLNLLAEIGFDGVSNAPNCLVNRISLFRSLYALNLSNTEEEGEYLPRSGVLELRHEKHIRSHHLDSCFSALSMQGVVLHSVDETCTLAVLPPSWAKSCGVETADVGWLSSHVTSRFPQHFEATAYRPIPVGGVRGGGGGLRATPKSLMRFVFRSLVR
ncbi:putative ribonuclease [Trypanosoma grayi]|uniref:putative ribonuclease n=1 Tax=Trypanosoma grayi TaxID=71804 RepID=UPI0004F3F45F|nr:putative ribonuclease [Trypanosoma grayi]KEG05913.1 putative ribonuclease [Trypanosoma grayi]